jgi:hypothetical protein
MDIEGVPLSFNNVTVLQKKSKKTDEEGAEECTKRGR